MICTSAFLNKLSPDVRKSKTVLDSGFHAVHSRFFVSGTWVPDPVVGEIPDSTSKNFPDSTTWGENRNKRLSVPLNIFGPSPEFNIKKHNLSQQLYKPRRKFSWPDAIENCCTLMKNCSIKLTMKYTANAKGNLTLLRILKHIQGKNITRYHSLSLNLFLTILFFQRL